MNHFKKTTRKNEKRRGIYFQMGFIIAGSLALAAFEWSSPIILSELPDNTIVYEEEWDMPIILPEKELEQPKSNERTVNKRSKQIKIVKNIIEPLPEPKPSPTPTFDPNEFKVVEPIVDKKIYTIPEVMPEYEGGIQEMFNYLGVNLRYPKREKELGIQGTVYLEFVVGKKGEIGSVRVIRGVNEAIDKEAIRVLKAMPKWKPGKQHGKAVKVRYNLPIKFMLR